MISKQDFKNLIHKIHIDSFVDSHKRLHEDNRGGFLIPIEFKIKDKEYERYRHLPVNWSISPNKERFAEGIFSKSSQYS